MVIDPVLPAGVAGRAAAAWPTVPEHHLAELPPVAQPTPNLLGSMVPPDGRRLPSPSKSFQVLASDPDAVIATNLTGGLGEGSSATTSEPATQLPRASY